MTDSAKRLLTENVIRVGSLDELNVDLINSHVDRSAFAAVRGLFSKEHMAAVYQRVRAGFDASRDRASIGERPLEVMKNFQKISIGGAGNHWDYRPRFMRVIYNPLWESQILRPVFRVLFNDWQNVDQIGRAHV